MRGAEHAPRSPHQVLDRRHGLAKIVERGGGVQVERLRVGKHNPPNWRGEHYGQTASAGMVEQAFGGKREDQILPVVVVKDPLTWLQSMCRVSYAAEFGRYRMAQCCPHPLVNTRTTTGFNNKRSDGVWRSASLAHLWSRWNSA